MIGGQSALPPTLQRPAVMAGNEVVPAQMMYRRLSTSGITTTEIVPSTSNPHSHFKRKEPQVRNCRDFLFENISSTSVSTKKLFLLVSFFFFSSTGWIYATSDSESGGKHNFVTT